MKGEVSPTSPAACCFSTERPARRVFSTKCETQKYMMNRNDVVNPKLTGFCWIITAPKMFSFFETVILFAQVKQEKPMTDKSKSVCPAAGTETNGGQRILDNLPPPAANSSTTLKHIMQMRRLRLNRTDYWINLRTSVQSSSRWVCVRVCVFWCAYMCVACIFFFFPVN